MIQSYKINELSSILLLFVREQLTTNRLKAVDKLMQMLLLVVQQPGSLGLSLLPSVLNFALNYVSPLLMQGENPSEYGDLAFSLYTLFDG